ncbi:MAG: methyltransferase domain-containing protein [Chloroflexi bacterium]|nr:methyltransferase domain-containing protein [Chloroflexota bacterium]GIW10963.1 MAG: hypothetical protein KatS3mg061_2020 [Dehalococcoidia bacterium]
MSPPERARVHELLREEYRAVARDPRTFTHHLTGRALAAALGYPPSWVASLPETVSVTFAGTGNPFFAGPLPPGWQVVDVGCGGGLDSLLAARQVGVAGGVIGVDLTPELLAIAEEARAALGLTQASFREGLAEALPLPSAWADAVIVNGLLNLVPERQRAVSEIVRVLRPGGWLLGGELVVTWAVPADVRADPAFWCT